MKMLKLPWLKSIFSHMLLFMVALSLPGYVFAQSNVTGKVSDETGAPIGGVTIIVKGKSVATTSLENGSYSIAAASGDVLVFSYIGYGVREVSVGASNVVDVTLLMQVNELEEVVAVGYGTQRKKDLTGAVSVVNVENAKKNATYDVARMLQGQVPGVSVHGSGEPGGFVQIKIRGISSLINNNPLFVVDGVPLTAPFDFSPDNIESIQVLKDASASAIYGSRGSTGVVIITTKKGKAGKMRVNYNGYYGVQSIARKWDLTDAEGYRKITNQAELNAGLLIAPGNDPNSPSFIGNVNTDWQEEAFQNGSIQDHNVSFSGGSEGINYNASLGLFDQTSTIAGPQAYRRYTFTLGLNGKRGRFSYGGKAFYTQSDKVNMINNTNSKSVFGGSVTSLVTAIPTMPVLDPNREGGYGGADNITQRAITLNVIGLNNLIKNESGRERFLGTSFFEFDIAKGLKYRLNLSYDRAQQTDFQFEPTYDLGWYYLNNISYLYRRVGTSTTKLAENLLTYRKEVGNHTFDILGGYTYQKDEGEFLAGSGINLRKPYFYTFNAIADASDKTLTSGEDAAALISFLGRVNYNYDNRYLVTLNFRRDGSSRFAEQNRWGNFPAVSAAWNLHNEKFFNLPSAISMFKIRAGYGEVGNQNIGNYLYQSFINTNAGYVFNNALAPGSTVVELVDPNIKWETKVTSNVAAEMGFMNNRLTVTAEYFYNKNNDLLAGVPISLAIGSFPWNVTTNAASIENSGFEWQVGYKGEKNDFRYDISVVGNTLKNKLTSLGLNDVPIFGNASKSEPGRSVGDIYGHKVAGIFQTQDEVNSWATQPNARPGDIKFMDLNGDKIISDEDREYLGQSIPTLYYGANLNFGYKQFDFSMFWQGSAGNKVYNGVYRDLMIGQYSNHHKDGLNFWTPNNTNTNIPRSVIGDPNANARASDRFVEDGSYIRLQNAQIGYTLKPGTVKWIENARIYISGQNVVTITKYSGLDADFISDGLFSRGFDLGSFPNPRTIIFGIQLGL
jgi:TonB-dependent starch-binding outer membrane protein SusC